MAIIKTKVLEWINQHIGDYNYAGTQPDEIFFECPFCIKKDGKLKYSLNLNKLLGHCFRCNHAGNFYKIVADFLQIPYLQVVGNFEDVNEVESYKDFYKKVNEYSLKLNEVRNVPLDHFNVKIDLPEGFCTYYDARSFPLYFRDREVSLNYIRDMKFGFTLKDDRYKNKIILPINCNGSRSFLAISKDRNARVKTLNPVGKLSVGGLLYNWDEVNINDKMLIVEGIFDWIRVDGYLKRAVNREIFEKHNIGAVCSFSNKITNAQIKLILRSHCDEIVFMFDGDQQGINGAKIYSKKLEKHFDGKISICNLPKDKDPDEINFEEFLEIFNKRRLYI